MLIYISKQIYSPRWIKLVIATLLLIIGGMIYISFRDTSLLLFKWLDYLNLSWIVDSFRIQQLDRNYYSWVIYNVPSALWLISYMLIIDFIWRRSSTLEYLIFLTILPILAILSEFAQLANLLPGTFDFYDLLGYILAVFIFYIFKFFYQ